MGSDRWLDTSDIKETCPLINEVISFIESIEIDESSYHSKQELIDLMEEIRVANSGLRDHGKTLQANIIELEGEITSLESRVDDLTRDNIELGSELVRLEDLVNYYENE